MVDGIIKRVGTKLEKSVGKFLDLFWPSMRHYIFRTDPGVSLVEFVKYSYVDFSPTYFYYILKLYL